MQPGTVTEKVLDRCVEWAVTQMLDYFHPFKQFEALNLTRCHKLTDLSVVEIVRSMPYITDLTLVVRVSPRACCSERACGATVCISLTYFPHLGVDDLGTACSHFAILFFRESADDSTLPGCD